ncbi:hypothetical protein ACFFNU_16030, partial [Sphingomonas yabuuchiae]
RSGVRGTPAKVNANAGLAASDKVNSASVSDGSHESVYSGPLYVTPPPWIARMAKGSASATTTICGPIQDARSFSGHVAVRWLTDF